MLETEEELSELLDELLDRFGNVPTSVQKLLQVALIKAVAHSAQVSCVSLKGGEVKLSWVPATTVNTGKIEEFLDCHKGQLSFSAAKGAQFVYKLNAVRGKSGARIDIWAAFVEIKSLLYEMKEKLG